MLVIVMAQSLIIMIQLHRRSGLSLTESCMS